MWHMFNFRVLCKIEYIHWTCLYSALCIFTTFSPLQPRFLWNLPLTASSIGVPRETRSFGLEGCRGGDGVPCFFGRKLGPTWGTYRESYLPKRKTQVQFRIQVICLRNSGKNDWAFHWLPSSRYHNLRRWWDKLDVDLGLKSISSSIHCRVAWSDGV